MKNIVQSASKLVLLYIVTILGLLALFSGVWGVVMGANDVIENILGAFVSALTFVLGFYFGSKGEPSAPFAGK